MPTFIDLSGDRGKENVGQRVVAGLLDELRGCGRGVDAYCNLVRRNEAEIVATIEGYVKQVGDKVARVMLSVNDYREELGVGLVSVNVQAQDEGRCAILVEGNAKSPTLGLVEPSNGKASRIARVGFQVGAGQAEQVSAVSNSLRFGHAAEAQNVIFEEQVPMAKGGKPITVPEREFVAAELPILDAGTLTASDLPYTELGRAADIPPPEGDQVYFCRYLTHKAADECVGE